jgi:hypothetical protein
MRIGTSLASGVPLKDPLTTIGLLPANQSPCGVDDDLLNSPAHCGDRCSSLFGLAGVANGIRSGFLTAMIDVTSERSVGP